MLQRATRRRTWREALASENPLILPAAHDALTARLIEQAGFHAFQVGGFALNGCRHAIPDLDLTHFGEEAVGVTDIVAATRLPLLVDGDDGYGDAKNVARTVRGYEAIGASALFLEDQKAPKKCGHMEGKEVIPAKQMVEKVRAAVALRERPETFLLARTDAYAPEGLRSALDRSEQYLAAGADGVYVEGPTTEEELKEIGAAFRGIPLATSVLERGGKTPALSPAQFANLGFSMILYPASILFRVTRAIQRGLSALREGTPLDPEDSVDLHEWMDVVDLSRWQEIERTFPIEK